MGLEWPRSFKLACPPGCRDEKIRSGWWMLLTIQRDRRAQDAITAEIFPPSLVVKNFVRKAFLSCSSNPELTVQELRDLIADPNKHPPSRPAAVAVWPVVPMETPTPAVLPNQPVGTPLYQSAQQTRGGNSY